MKALFCILYIDSNCLETNGIRNEISIAHKKKEISLIGCW